jgi:hypothetical protein
MTMMLKSPKIKSNRIPPVDFLPLVMLLQLGRIYATSDALPLQPLPLGLGFLFPPKPPTLLFRFWGLGFGV